MSTSALFIKMLPESSDGVSFLFKVTKSADDQILGSVQSMAHRSSPAKIQVETTSTDVPVQEVWLEALAIAHEYKVPLIEIDDPQGLFPDSKRCIPNVPYQFKIVERT